MTLLLLQEQINQKLADAVVSSVIAYDELTIEINRSAWPKVALILRDEPSFAFEQCVDLCGVDYLTYGLSEWETTEANNSGFERGVIRNPAEQKKIESWTKPRFAVVYHLLSLQHNQRLSVRVFPDENNLCIDSMISIWPSVNWYEREAYDLFGIVFQNHPDLRRILTDYDFSGHPFRKDFPLIGHVEMRYDAKTERVIYEPVSIKPRTLVPKVIRQDNRDITNHE